MKFLKNITAEHAALLAIGVQTHSDQYCFNESLECGNLVGEFVYLDGINPTPCDINKIDKIKNYLSLLIDAIQFEMNEYIEFTQSCDTWEEYTNCDPFDLPDTLISEPVLNTKIIVSHIKMKRSGFLGGPFDDGNKTEPDLKVSLINKESVAKWLEENEEPAMARRVYSRCVIKQKEESTKNMKRAIQTLEHSMANAGSASQLLRNIPVTIKNIELFKSQLPECWSDALFTDSELTIKEETLDFDDDTPDRLYTAESLYKQVWQGFDPNTTNLPKREEVVKIARELDVTEPKDIDAVIRVSMPNGIVFGGHKSPDKENWASLSERNTRRVIK